MKLISFILCFALLLDVFGNNEVDSLKTELLNAQEDSMRFRLNCDLSILYINIDNDSALQYGMATMEYAKKVGKEWIIAQAAYNLGEIYHNLGQYRLAEENYRKCISISETVNDTDRVIMGMNALGVVYDVEMDYKKSLEVYSSAHDLAIKSNNTEQIFYTCNNLGGICFATKDFKQGLEYLNEALQLSEKMKDLENTAICLDNMGVMYEGMGDQEKSIIYSSKALELRRKIGNPHEIGIGTLNLGTAYLNNSNYTDAIPLLKESIMILDTLDSRYLYSLANTNLALVYLELNELELTEKYLDIAYADANEIESNYVLIDILDYYSQLWEARGNYDLAYDWYLKHTELAANIMNQEKYEQITELNTRFQSKQKELKIDNLKKEKAIRTTDLKRQDSLSRRQKTIMLSSIAGLLIIMGLGTVLFVLLRNNKKLNSRLKNQNEQINQKKEEILTQRDEILQQRNVVTAQRDEISKIHEELTDSISYATNIQQAVLPEVEKWSDSFCESFVLFKPKDVVSGDFYWHKSFGNKTVFAVSDCTGHGVPGALMSMLGVSFLNEICASDIKQHAGEILDKLREMIIDSLGQRGEDDAITNQPFGSSVKDGMDISICIYDKEAMTIDFAGANNPVYIISKNELKELRPNKMPIAIHEKMDSFKNEVINVAEGDQLYLFSDGFADQFGGPGFSTGGKKYKYKAFKELLLETSDLNLQEQKEHIEAELWAWMAGKEKRSESPANDFSGNAVHYLQVDDITILGIRI